MNTNTDIQQVLEDLDAMKSQYASASATLTQAAAQLQNQELAQPSFFVDLLQNLRSLQQKTDELQAKIGPEFHTFEQIETEWNQRQTLRQQYLKERIQLFNQLQTDHAPARQQLSALQQEALQLQELSDQEAAICWIESILEAIETTDPEQLYTLLWPLLNKLGSHLSYALNFHLVYVSKEPSAHEDPLSKLLPEDQKESEFSASPDADLKKEPESGLEEPEAEEFTKKQETGADSISEKESASKDSICKEEKTIENSIHEKEKALDHEEDKDLEDSTWDEKKPDPYWFIRQNPDLGEEWIEESLDPGDLQWGPLKYRTMLANGSLVEGLTYLHTLSLQNPDLKNDYKQLAYALNDPKEDPKYTSEEILELFELFDEIKDDWSQYLILATSLRSHFYDDIRYDPSLTTLQTTLQSLTLSSRYPEVQKLLDLLAQIKLKYHFGLNYYAYQKSTAASASQTLMELKREAQDLITLNKSTLSLNKSTQQIQICSNLLFSEDSPLGKYLNAVASDSRSMADEMEAYMGEHFLKKRADSDSWDLDPAKKEARIEEAWDKAFRICKEKAPKSRSANSNVFGHHKNTLNTRIDSICKLTIRYLHVVRSLGTSTVASPSEQEIKEIENQITLARKTLEEDVNPPDGAGWQILRSCLQELAHKLNGSWNVWNKNFFYRIFLLTPYVPLDEKHFPVQFAEDKIFGPKLLERIEQHYLADKPSWEERLQDIFEGQDDYGSALMIMEWLEKRSRSQDKIANYRKYLDTSRAAAASEAESKWQEFKGNLELAVSFGKLDASDTDEKEQLSLASESWYTWAKDSGNFGFFSWMLEESVKQIDQKARERQTQVQEQLNPMSLS